MINKKSCAVVLGGYVNGYSIIRELYDSGVRDIVLVDYNRSLSSFSNKVLHQFVIDRDKESLLSVLNQLHKKYENIILYPTDDIQLEFLVDIYKKVCDFCFIPFNPDNLIKTLDKSYQYFWCEKLGIPYPVSRTLETEADWQFIRELRPPLLVKPSKRDDLTSSVFRNAFFETYECLESARSGLFEHVRSGVKFVVSEFIPGNDTNIYAYTAYRSFDGRILNEWIGKKLTQYPDNFGVFSSAANVGPDVIQEYGRRLLNGMNLWGIAEPEFKYDERDGQYKLMEINLRSMMWHRTGNLSGVKLQYTQWLDAAGIEPPRQQQNRIERIHYIYMKHELLNLISRNNYFKYFKRNIFNCNKCEFAVFNWADLKPFIYDLLSLSKEIMGTWLKRWRKH
ncbi:hypothetical protein [Pseudidiomarina aestuarii]|uniref:carboxylate--amine ligase n=1 Tax=Pseudidiomarina aestuarii TaxID=624146 RepID=UPI003A987AC3